MPAAMAQGAVTGRMTRKRRIVLIGYPHFAQPLADLLSDDSWECRYAAGGASLRLPMADALYQIGGERLVPERLFRLCRMLRRRVVKHWVGTDAESAGLPDVLAQDRSGLVTHWADSPWIADELRAAGLNAEIVALNYVPDEAALPLPPAPLRVLVYLPDGRADHYGPDSMMRLAGRLPRAQFLVVGASALPHGAPPNVTLLGIRRSMTDVYRMVHALVRMPRRDGMSFMVTEALAQARYAVWNRPMTGADLALDEEQAFEALARYERRLIAGELKENAAGRAYALAEFGPKQAAKRLHDALDRALAHGGT